MSIPEGEMREKLLERVAELATDAVFVLGRDGKIKSCISRSHQHTLEGLQGSHVTLLWPPELRQEGERILERARGGAVLRDIITGWRMQNSTITVSITIAPIHSGEPGEGLVMVVRDVTKEMEAERRLSSYIRELTQYIRHVERSSQLKDTFADIMRHDILNPLSAIKSAISSGRVNDRGIALIKKSVDRIEKIVEMFSKYAFLHSVEELSFQEGNLSEMLDEVVDTLTPAALEMDVRVVKRYPPVLTARFSPFLEEAVANLLSNAIKFSPAGGEVVLEAGAEDGWVTLRVRDRGPGIPDRYKKSIFERFVRGRKDGIKGSGLGLAIVRRIAEMHRGEVWVEDNVVEYQDGSGRVHQKKQGSVFVLRIPGDCRGGVSGSGEERKQ